MLHTKSCMFEMLKFICNVRFHKTRAFTVLYFGYVFVKSKTCRVSIFFHSFSSFNRLHALISTVLSWIEKRGGKHVEVNELLLPKKKINIFFHAKWTKIIIVRIYFLSSIKAFITQARISSKYWIIETFLDAFVLKISRIV